MTVLERFKQKFNLSPSGCWEWIAASRGNGYGCFKLNGKSIDAHRVSFMLFKGDIPKNTLVCHTCDNKKCVNPEHLFLGTYKDNFNDAVKKGRIKLNKKPFSHNPVIHPSSTTYRNGCRCNECKKIQRDRMRNYRELMTVAVH